MRNVAENAAYVVYTHHYSTVGPVVCITIYLKGNGVLFYHFSSTELTALFVL